MTNIALLAPCMQDHEMHIKQRGAKPRMIPLKTATETMISMKNYRWSKPNRDLIDIDQFDIEKEIMEALTKQITYEIDRSFMRMIKAPKLVAVEEKLKGRKMRKFIAKKKYEHTLSFRKHLGEQSDGWETKLDRFQPVEAWSYEFLDDDSDCLFSFISDEDRVAFLLLMR